MHAYDSDMDIVVITKEDHSTSKIHKKFAFRVADHLRRSGVVRAGFSDDTGEEGIQVNHFAPVPIVKCRSLSSWGESAGNFFKLYDFRIHNYRQYSY